MAPKCGNVACLGGVRRARVRADAPRRRLRRQYPNGRRFPRPREPSSPRAAHLTSALSPRKRPCGARAGCPRVPPRPPPCATPAACCARPARPASPRARRGSFRSSSLKNEARSFSSSRLFLASVSDVFEKRKRSATTAAETARAAVQPDRSLRTLPRSRGLTPFPTRTTLAGTSAAGSARGARPSTASARRRTTRRSARQDPAPNSGSGATGATDGRTSRASSPTTPRVSERDARCRSRRRLRFVFRATSHLAIASITRSVSIKRLTRKRKR